MVILNVSKLLLVESMYVELVGAINSTLLCRWILTLLTDISSCQLEELQPFLSDRPSNTSLGLSRKPLFHLCMIASPVKGFGSLFYLHCFSCAIPVFECTGSVLRNPALIVWGSGRILYLLTFGNVITMWLLLQVPFAFRSLNVSDLGKHSRPQIGKFSAVVSVPKGLFFILLLFLFLGLGGFKWSVCSSRIFSLLGAFYGSSLELLILYIVLFSSNFS